jgi:Tat protein secretion system quality control protein TatD with DNase activity
VIAFGEVGLDYRPFCGNPLMQQRVLSTMIKRLYPRIGDLVLVLHLRDVPGRSLAKMYS